MFLTLKKRFLKEIFNEEFIGEARIVLLLHVNFILNGFGKSAQPGE